ncbi:cysteine proteinase, partial [Polyporus arcularius HHB13444]
RGWLSSGCIDGCATLLQAEECFRNASTAVFSCFLLDTFVKDGPEDTLWRIARSTHYWEKDVWVIPIHNEGHWLLATVRRSRRTITIFDSFGLSSGHKRFGIPIFHLCRKLSTAVRTYSDFCVDVDGRWTVHPATLARLQNNDYDCGVWLLACMAAVLRGYTTIAMTENKVVQFRSWLFLLAFSLPTT